MKLKPRQLWFYRTGKPIRNSYPSSWRVERLLRSWKYKKVARSRVNGCVVSTVWLALDFRHSLNPNAPPTIFETMIFFTAGGNWKGINYQERYSTLKEARRGHHEAIEWLRKLDCEATVV